jgi:membrane-bound ClpP family serine protease
MPYLSHNARTPIYPEGIVLFAGKSWDAISKEPIHPGTRVRIKRVLLEVEKA